MRRRIVRLVMQDVCGLSAQNAVADRHEFPFFSERPALSRKAAFVSRKPMQARKAKFMQAKSTSPFMTR